MKKKIFFVMSLFLMVMLAVKGNSVYAGAKTTYGNSITNIINGGYTCEYKGKIYYGIYGALYCANKDGTNVKKIYQTEDSNGFSHINVYNGYVYCIFNYYYGSDDGGNTKLLKIKLDGSSCQILDTATTVMVVNGKIYYTKARLVNEDGYKMKSVGAYRMDLSGKNKKCLVKDSQMRWVVTDGRKLYYETYKNMGKTYSTNMKGEKSSRVCIGGGEEKCIGVKNGCAYIVSLTDGGVFRQKKNTGSFVKVGKLESASYYNIYMDDNYIYYTNDFDNTRDYSEICKVHIKSGKSRRVVKGEYVSIAGIHGSRLTFTKGIEDANLNNTALTVIKKNGKGSRIMTKYFTS